jgi:hypothetical protein
VIVQPAEAHVPARGGGGADFRDDLLRGIDAESGDLGEALHRVVVGREQVDHLLIELAEVILDHAQFLQRELQQPVNRMQRRTRLGSACSVVIPLSPVIWSSNIDGEVLSG